jgi:hypothetical protein
MRSPNGRWATRPSSPSFARFSQTWALIAGGFGLATLGAKLERTRTGVNKAGETVSEIADRALRR